MVEEIPVSLCRGRKPARHPYPRAAEIADHLTERGVLATYLVHIPHACLIQAQYILLQSRFS